MNKNLIIGIIAVLVLVGGGIYVASNQSKKAEEAKMMQEKAAMKATESAAMMKKEEDAKMMKEKEVAAMKKDGGKDGTMMGTGYILKNGALMLDADGKMSAITQGVTLKDGSTVSLTGLVTRKDGTTVQLKEGESIWPDGSIVSEKAMMKEKEDAAMKK